MGKIIGIVGGVGPLAGVDFHRKIIEATKAGTDQEHLEIYHISASEKIGDRSAYLQDRNLPNPAYGIIYVMEKLLQIGAKILTIPCNTAHSAPILSPVLDFLQDKDVTFLNLVEQTCLEIKNLNLRKVGLLSTHGTYGSGVYADYFSQLDCGELLLPDDFGKNLVSSAIYDGEKGIKSGGDFSWAKDRLDSVAHDLIEKGAEAIIMGCTEIPLAMQQKDFDVSLLDPCVILAQKVVKEVGNWDI